jgi:hypothetical protein
LSDSGPWKPAIGNRIVWRPITPEKWVGTRDFSRVTTPADNRTNQLSGDSVTISPLAEEKFTPADRNCVRTRDKDLEICGEFSSVVTRDSYLRSPSAYKNFDYWVNPVQNDCLKNSIKGAKLDDGEWLGRDIVGDEY